MNGRTLTGCGTALVTPFRRDGQVDEAALRRFVEWQVAEGVHFVVGHFNSGVSMPASTSSCRAARPGKPRR